MKKKNIIFKLKYRANKKEKLRILNQKFITNNYRNCKIIYKNKKFNLNEYFDGIDKDYKDKYYISIKLIFNNKFIDTSYMFYECNSLISMSNISKGNNINIRSMNYMFYKCNSLSLLTGLPQWDISKVTDMSSMFEECR